MRILITGANGFVGLPLCREAVARGLAVRGVSRTVTDLPVGVETKVVGDIGENTQWHSVLDGCEVVIHLAARAHVIQDEAADPLAEFRRVNVNGTVNLARQAAEAGVRRFVFISSIGVNGAETFQQAFSAGDEAHPHSPYAVSKYEAELALQKLVSETAMELVIIRPPLIYGAGAKGNFATLTRVVSKGLPLPLGAIDNKRTLVGVDNLISLIITCIDHPAAANQVFLAGDAEDISTSDLLRRIAAVLGKSPRLLPVPQSWLLFVMGLARKKSLAQQLFGSLQVDSSKAGSMLGWKPSVSIDEGLRRCFDPSRLSDT